MKILVIDDSFTMRRIIKAALIEGGYKDLVEAVDGADGLKKLDGIDFIITDWNMPNVNGLTFVKTVRSNPKHKHLPIIMVTTEAGKKDVIIAIKSGVNNYIVKPFKHETLHEKIKLVLDKIKAKQSS